MDQFLALCSESADYPECLIHYDSYDQDYSLKGLVQRLNEQQNRLFFNEDRAAVDFLDYRDDKPGMLPRHELVWNRFERKSRVSLLYTVFRPARLRSFEELKEHLGIASTPASKDPLCRFM